MVERRSLGSAAYETYGVGQYSWWSAGDEQKCDADGDVLGGVSLDWVLAAAVRENPVDRLCHGEEFECNAVQQK